MNHDMMRPQTERLGIQGYDTARGLHEQQDQGAVDCAAVTEINPNLYFINAPKTITEQLLVYEDFQLSTQNIMINAL